jgi:ketosteroid isomerase-like protein
MPKLYSNIQIVIVCLFSFSCNTDVSKKEVSGSEKASTFNQQWAQSFIDSINSKFSEQFRAKDSVALAAHYWPDAELLLSNSESIKGADMVSAWGVMTRMGIKDFTFSSTNVSGDYEFIINTGNYEMKDEKDAVVDKGKYVVVWQQRNGEWKLFRDIGNTSLPLPK